MASAELTTLYFFLSHLRDVYLDFATSKHFLYFYFQFSLLLIVWSQEVASKSELMELCLLEVFSIIIFIG